MKKILTVCVMLIIVVIAGLFFFLKKNGGELAGFSIKERVWQERVDAAFRPVDCPKSDRVLPKGHYKGQLIDTHIHIPPIPDGPPWETFSDDGRPAMGGNVFMADFVCIMDYEGTSKVFAFFPVWEPITKQLLEVVKRTIAMYPDRFVPFIMPPFHDDEPDGYPTVTANELQDMLAVYPELFRGYGEIGLYARGDHGGPTGSPALPPDSRRLLDIYPVVREHNLLVYFHLGQGQQASFERVLNDNPDINFIWHGDQLIPYNHGVQNLQYIEEILDNHSNVYYGVDELYGDVWLLRPDISKEKFFAHFKDPEALLKKDLDTWKGFIERHPDQVLWGTDRGAGPLWSLDTDVALTLNTYSRAFIGRLDPTVQEKFAYKNAERLLEGK